MLESEGWWCWLPLTSPPTNQKNVHELIMPSSLNHYYKTPHYPLQVRTHSFEGLLWPPLCGEAINLFFSSLSKTLSLRFNLMLGYRGQIQLQRLHLWKVCHMEEFFSKWINDCKHFILSYYIWSLNIDRIRSRYTSKFDKNMNLCLPTIRWPP